MGWLQHHREKQAAAQAAAAAAERAAARAAWDKQFAEASEDLELAKSFFGAPPDQAPDGVLLDAGEKLYMYASGAVLVEVRHGQGHYVGGTQGVSLHIMKGVNYRVGSLRGHYEPGPETPTPLDQGALTITDKRVVFAGQKQTREWLFDKLLGYTHSTDAPWTALQVSNRQKVSGFAYDQENADAIKFRLELAITAHRGTRDAMIQHCQQAIDQLRAREPSPLDTSQDPAQPQR